MSNIQKLNHMPKKILLTTEKEFELLTQFTQDTLKNKSLKVVLQNQDQYKNTVYENYFNTNEFKKSKQTLDKIKQHDLFFRAMCYLEAIRKEDDYIEVLAPKKFDSKTDYSFSEEKIKNVEEIILESINEQIPLDQVLLSCVGIYDLVLIEQTRQGIEEQNKDLLINEDFSFKDFSTFGHFQGSLLKQIHDQTKIKEVKDEINNYWSFENNKPRQLNNEKKILGLYRASFAIPIYRIIEPNFNGELIDYFPNKYLNEFKKVYSSFKDDLDFTLAIKNREEEKVISLLNKEKLDLIDLSQTGDFFSDVQFIHFLAKYLPTTINIVFDMMSKNQIQKIPQNKNRYSILGDLVEKRLFDDIGIDSQLSKEHLIAKRSKFINGLLAGLNKSQKIEALLEIRKTSLGFDDFYDYLSPQLLIGLIKVIPETEKKAFFEKPLRIINKNNRDYNLKIYRLFSIEKEYLGPILEAFGTNFKKEHCNHSISKLIDLGILAPEPNQIFSYAKKLAEYPETNLNKLYSQIKQYLNPDQREEFKEIQEQKKKEIKDKIIKPITNVLRKKKGKYKLSDSHPSDHAPLPVELISFQSTKGATSQTLSTEIENKDLLYKKEKKSSPEDTHEKKEQRTQNFMRIIPPVTSQISSKEATKVIPKSSDSKREESYKIEPQPSTSKTSDRKMEGLKKPSNFSIVLAENLASKLPEVPTHEISENIKKEKSKEKAKKKINKAPRL